MLSHLTHTHAHVATHTHGQIVAISGWMSTPRQELLPAFGAELINHSAHWLRDALRGRTKIQRSFHHHNGALRAIMYTIIMV